MGKQESSRTTALLGGQPCGPAACESIASHRTTCVFHALFTQQSAYLSARTLTILQSRGVWAGSIWIGTSDNKASVGRKPWLKVSASLSTVASKVGMSYVRRKSATHFPLLSVPHLVILVLVVSRVSRMVKTVSIVYQWILCTAVQSAVRPTWSKTGATSLLRTHYSWGERRLRKTTFGRATYKHVSTLSLQH